MALPSSVLTPVVKTLVSPRKIETETRLDLNLMEEALLVPRAPKDLNLRTK